jgi:hypothetical protein
LTQRLEETRACQIGFVPVRTLAAAIVNLRIDIAWRLKLEITIAPPPLLEIGINRFVIDTFAVGGERFIEPRLERLIVCDRIEPPLMRPRG